MYYDAIIISNLNDFVFCPKSIYFHGIYHKFNQKMYHRAPQTRGSIGHENIDKRQYSSAKRYIQNMEVYNEKYNILGKIDVYDRKQKSLIERKYRLKKIYDGHRFQLYAQYFCLLEMGYEVEKLFIHSLADNKRFEIALPKGEELEKFENLIDEMRNFDILKNKFKQNPAKCEKCIYRELCDQNNAIG